MNDQNILDRIISATATGNITWLEIFWTTLGVLGVVVNLWGIRQSSGDYRRAKALGPPAGSLLIVASSEVRREAIRMIMHTIVIAIGVAAMFPPSKWLGYLIVFGLVSQPLLLIIQSVMDRLVRRAVERNVR